MQPTRQLAVIMFADIAGYTALMETDERQALELINRFKDLLDTIIPQYKGKIVQYFGDGCLITFESSVHSIDCAIALQKVFCEPPEIPVRIGLHMGDVLFKNENVFGDGVNIASRIESLAIPGSVLMSKSIRDQVKNNSDFLLVSLGSFEFKNVSESLEVFALANPGFVIPKREEMQGKLKSSKSEKGIYKWVAAIALIILLGFVIFYFLNRNNESDTIGDKSIAVLPFVNMSNDKDQEYFSDGLSEELLDLLTKIPELKVIGRTSSFSFKGKNEDLRSIGNKLDVEHLLEGSVRKDGNKIRVTAQLVKASDGSHIWSDTYDRDFKDLLKLQEEIAKAVVSQLKIKLLSDKLSSSPVNADAYNLILKGNFLVEKRDKESLEKALDFYLQALAIDSMDARSWEGIAKCYSLQATWGWIGHRDGYEKAEVAARKAISLDKNLADAHRTLGAVKMNRFDWKEAEAEYQLALDIEPGNADILRMKGLMYRSLGRYEEAIQLTRKSITLDPIKGVAYLNNAIVLFYANKYEESSAVLKKLLELSPQFPRAHAFLLKVYLLQNKPELALQEIERETDETWKTFGLALAYHALGRQEDFDSVFSYFLNQVTGESYLKATIYAYSGNKEKAFEFLEKAFSEGEPMLSFLKNDPLMKNIWRDPRYLSLLKRINVPQD